MTFTIGNKYSQEWTLENAQPRFEDALKFATEDETCLCMQDAIVHTGIPNRTFYYLVNNEPVLHTIKEDIQDQIVRRVNRKALDSTYAAAPAIWRMKQLGERDEQHINTTGSTETKIIVTDQKTVEDIEKLKERFENE